MVPYATAPFERRGSSTSTTATSPADTLTPVTSATTYKFPDFAPQTIDEDEELQNLSRGPSPKPLQNGLPLGLHSSERWPFKKQGGMDGGRTGAQSDAPRATRHGRQKSLSEAIHTVRMRKMSVSESTAEIAESLKAPISYRLVVCVQCCGLTLLTTKRLTDPTASVRRLVFRVHPHEYVLQGHSHRPPETRHSHRYAILSSVLLVHLSLLACQTQP